MPSNKSRKKREKRRKAHEINQKFKPENMDQPSSDDDGETQNVRKLSEEKSASNDDNFSKMDSSSDADKISDKMLNEEIKTISVQDVTSCLSGSSSKGGGSSRETENKDGVNNLSSKRAKRDFDHSNLYKFSGQRDKFNFFYLKQNPFSQFFAAKFEVDGITYNCCEQFMMHQKAVTFKDEDAAKKILESNRPDEMKRIGRKVKNFDEAIWSVKSFEVVKKGNMAKFSQNPELKRILLETGDKVLVEASPYDKIWGIGLGEDHPDACHPEKWEGANQLGEVLIQVRRELGERIDTSDINQ